MNIFGGWKNVFTLNLISRKRWSETIYNSFVLETSSRITKFSEHEAD